MRNMCSFESDQDFVHRNIILEIDQNLLQSAAVVKVCDTLKPI